MIGLFKQKSPANIVLLFIFGLLLKLPLFLYPKAIVATDKDGRLYQYFISFINSDGGTSLLASLIALMLLYVQALLVNYMVNE
ncbi:MAG TPA: hypothetical protein VM888_11065, partial [Chitinophagaceae bacterium]|nr:hypothetical protein [Chitinophagaceae bacterium]